jgi:hypothetical protein
MITPFWLLNWPLGGDSFSIGRHFQGQILALALAITIRDMKTRSVLSHLHLSNTAEHSPSLSKNQCYQQLIRVIRYLCSKQWKSAADIQVENLVAEFTKICYVREHANTPLSIETVTFCGFSGWVVISKTFVIAKDK